MGSPGHVVVGAAHPDLHLAMQSRVLLSEAEACVEPLTVAWTYVSYPTSSQCACEFYRLACAALLRESSKHLTDPICMSWRREKARSVQGVIADLSSVPGADDSDEPAPVGKPAPVLFPLRAGGGPEAQTSKNTYAAKITRTNTILR